MRKLTHFDGLRGIAAFIVFLAHFRPTFCLNINQQILDVAGVTNEKTRLVVLNFMSLLYEGALPVFIFWILSAYVISVKLFQSDRNKSEKYLVEASTKRYFRLAIPVVAASFICFALLRLNFIYNIQLSERLGGGYSDGWLNQQYHFVPGILHFLRTTFIEVFMNGNCNYNFVLWTMAPELLGSFMCFGLFAIIGTNKQRYIVYLTSLVLLMFGGFRDVTYFFYLTFMTGIMWCDAMNSTDDDVAFKPFVKKIFESKVVTLILLTLSFAVPIFSETVYALPVNLYYLLAFPVKAMAITLGVHQ
jgi:peptidoglycan/LPS O-acetylase OafA/YrhL